MIDGLAVVDAHMHVPRLSTVSAAWMDWAVLGAPSDMTDSGRAQLRAIGFTL